MDWIVRIVLSYMMITELANQAPRVGERVQPFNDERYYFITRLNRNKVYYRWEPAEGSPFKPREERYVPLELLDKKAIRKDFFVWEENAPASSDIPADIRTDVKAYKGKINWYNKVYERETVAPSNEKAKSNLVKQFADEFDVRPNAVWTYIKTKPQSFELRELK
jgi:hypothetical protein